LLKRGGKLEVGPNNFVFFNGKGTQFVYTNPLGALTPFYDTFSEGYIDGALNQPAGAVSFTVQGE
jgi:hypothetical protein